jgi:hypothetical protein
LSGRFGISPTTQDATKNAKAALQATELYHQYAKEVTFGEAVTNAAKQAGTYITAYNIGPSYPSMVHYVPYSTENSEILDAYTLPIQTDPSRLERYGFILGPSIINNVTRSYTRTPPQQTTTHSPATQVQTVPTNKASTPKEATPKPVQSTQELNNTKTSAPIGPSGGSANPNVRLKKSPLSGDLQQALQKEQVARMNFTTLMVPVLVGIKPNDIVFIPNFEGTFIEDWIVQEVSYSQTDGGVELSVSGSRLYGTTKSMNQKATDQFAALCKQYKLTGEGATLAHWDTYAWAIGTNRFAPTSTATGNT